VNGVLTQKTSRAQLQNHEQELKNVLKRNVANRSVLWPVYQWIIRALKNEYCRHLVCTFLQTIITIKECYKGSLFDAICMRSDNKVCKLATVCMLWQQWAMV
jgi:hypothetical protein